MKHPFTAWLIALVLSSSPLSVCAEEPHGGADLGMDWELSDHVLTISGAGSIPNSTGHQPAWKTCAEDVYEIIIAEGITGADTYALSDFPNLQKLTLPATFRTLHPYALAGNAQLETIEGLSNVTQFDYQCLTGTAYIAAHPFVVTDGKLYYAECSDFNVPAGVTEIMPFAFGNLTGKEFIIADGVVPVSVTLPEGVEVIRENAFAFCAGLTEINIPDSVTKIGARAFYDCVHLQDITLGEHVEAIGSQAFFNCKSLETLTLRSTDTVIGKDAYGTCFDWYKALEARRSRYDSEEAYQAAVADLDAHPLSMDEELANFAVHFWSTRSYNSIKFSSFNSMYFYHSGILTAPAASTAQTFAHEAKLPFRRLDGECLPGDVTLDDLVDIIDVIWLNKYLLGCCELPPRAVAAADYDGSGSVDETDSLRLLRYLVGIDPDRKSVV